MARQIKHLTFVLWSNDTAHGMTWTCRHCKAEQRYGITNGYTGDVSLLTNRTRQFVKDHKDCLNLTLKMCECCGKREGELNSSFLFSTPTSSHDCGDWVCHECEQEAENDHNQIEHPPYG